MVSAARRKAAARSGAGAEDLTTAIEKLNSSNQEEQAGACVVLAFKANVAGVDGTQLAKTVARLVELLYSDNVSVKKNAATALANAMETQDSCWAEGVRCYAGPAFVSLLGSVNGAAASNAASASDDGAAGAAGTAFTAVADEGVVINGLAGCTCLVGGGPEGAQQVLASKFVEAWLGLMRVYTASTSCSTAGDASEAGGASAAGAAGGGGEGEAAGADTQHAQQAQQAVSMALLEAALDPVCKLATLPQCRSELADKGVMRVLAKLLGSCSDAEVLVRLLLTAGMLLGQPGVAKQLAGEPQAIATLLGLMRQTDDEDCRQLASDVFRALGSDEATRGLVKDALMQMNGDQQR